MTLVQILYINMQRILVLYRWNIRHCDHFNVIHLLQFASINKKRQYSTKSKLKHFDLHHALRFPNNMPKVKKLLNELIINSEQKIICPQHTFLIKLEFGTNEVEYIHTSLISVWDLFKTVNLTAIFWKFTEKPKRISYIYTHLISFGQTCVKLRILSFRYLCPAWMFWPIIILAGSIA